MKKFIPGREMVAKVLGIVVLVVGIGLVEYMAFSETTAWVSEWMVEVIQEDNSFLAQSR